MIYYYERFNKTQNNIVTLKNSNIALQNNIIKHKTKLLHIKQQYNKTRHQIVTYNIVL